LGITVVPEMVVMLGLHQEELLLTTIDRM